jgi:hypothetical protein
LRGLLGTSCQGSRAQQAEREHESSDACGQEAVLRSRYFGQALLRLDADATS